MSALIVYQIVMGTGLALSVDGNDPGPGSEVILNTSNSQDWKQQWLPVFFPQAQASALLNPACGLYAAPSAISKGAGVILQNLPNPLTFNGGNTWQMFQDSAVRPPANTDLNMNALGDEWGPNTKIGLWTWDGGAKNEVWTFRPVLVEGDKAGFNLRRASKAA